MAQINKNGKKEITIEDIKAEFERIGSTNQTIFNENRSSHIPQSRIVIERLGMKWNEIVEACGYDPLKKSVNKDNMIQIAKRVYADYGRITYELLGVHGCSETAINNYFGTMSEFCKVAGVPYAPSDRLVVTESNDKLIEMYRAFSDRIGRPARIRDLNESDEIYNYEIFRSRFGSINKLRELANLPVTQHKERLSKNEVLDTMCDIYIQHGRVLYSQLEELLSFGIRTLFRKFGTNKINVIWDEVHKECEQRGLL